MTIPIDTGAVREQLAAAEQQIEQLQAFSAWLRQGLELAGEPADAPAALAAVPAAPAAPEPPAAKPSRAQRKPAPRKPAAPRTPSPATGAGRDGLSARQQEVLTAINTFGTCSRKQLIDELGFDPSDQIKALLRRGLVDASGNTNSRRFHARARKPIDERRARPHDSLGLAQSPAASREMDQGVLRVKVIDTLRRDPGALNVPRLAQALILDQDRVGRAVDELVEAGKVTVAADGTLTALTERELRLRRAAA